MDSCGSGLNLGGKLIWFLHLPKNSSPPPPFLVPIQLYPEYIYSIVRLLRPEHVIEQWQEQQREVADKAAAAGAGQHQFSIPAEPQALPPGASSPQPLAGMDSADLANGGGGSMTSHGSGTVKQPPGQVAQARFALTSAFLEKVRSW